MYRVLAKIGRGSDVLTVFKIFRFSEIERNIFLKSTSLLVLLLLIFHSLQAQIYDDDLTLSTQAEVNTFNYTEIKGDLIISATDINDLSPLSVLTTVDGLQIVSNALLINLNGLQNLTSVNGNLIIKDNPALVNLTGLENITTVEGYLKILSNDALLSLDKLQNINSVQGSLEVYNNAVLTNLNGLHNINSTGGYLKIRSNGALVSLDKLQNIKTVGGSLEIYNNDKIVDLNGLQNITIINGFLRIASNDALSNLDGLQNITTINGYLEIYNNDAIINLFGLQNIISVEQNLEINGNAVLSDFCALYSLINEAGLLGTYSVSGNFVNPTQQQIIENGPCTIEIPSAITAIGTPFSIACDSWKVPVTVHNLKNVDAISLKVDFNKSHLTFIGVDLNAAIASAAFNESDGLFSLGYFGDEITLPDSAVLFTLNFTVTPAINGTPFILNWSKVPGDCEYAGSSGEPFYFSTFNDLDVNIITDYLPEIDGPEDTVVENDEGVCGAVVTYSAPVGTDNCPGAITKQIAGLPSGAKFPIGNTTNIFQVIDSQGNIGKCCFTITVNDTEAPVIIDCPENITKYTNDRSTCDQVVTWIPPTAKDNCSLFSLKSNYESGTKFPVGTTTVTYIASDYNIPANISTCSFKITVIDNTPPTINTCALPQAAIVTDGCSVEIPNFVSDEIVVSDNCGSVTITQSPLAGEWMSFEDTPHDVTITASDEAGNTSVCVTTFTVLKAEINGTLVYNNPAQTPLNNVTISLFPGELTCITDDNGNYRFTDLCAQTYTIKVTNNEKSVGYINSTDASAVNKWGTQGESIEYVCFLAGDVFDDLFINSTDALRIQNNFVYGTEFNRSNWSYWKKGSNIINNTDPYLIPNHHPNCINVDVSGKNLYDFDLYALCTGDFNGSFTPLKSAGSSLSFGSGNNLQIGKNCEFELPLRAGFSMEVGAVSLIVDLPSKFVEVTDVVVNKSEIPVSWLFKENELRIGWNSVTPVSVAASENLITLKLKTTDAFKFGQFFEPGLINSPLNEIADGNSEVIQGAILQSFTVRNSLTDINEEIKTDALLLRNYPNPFSNSTTLEYDLPFEGIVNIDVYNQLGQLVLQVVDESRKPGQYSIKDFGESLQNGLYIAKFTLTDYKTNTTCHSNLNIIKF